MIDDMANMPKNFIEQRELEELEELEKDCVNGAAVDKETNLEFERKNDKKLREVMNPNLFALDELPMSYIAERTNETAYKSILPQKINEGAALVDGDNNFG